MKQIAILILMTVVGQVQAQLISPYSSTVKGIDIHNTHRVDDGVLRGMAPLSSLDVLQLWYAGVDQVLIFRNDMPGEPGVENELQLFKSTLGENHPIAFENIPFKWRAFEGAFTEPCQQVVRALRLLRKTQARHGKVFFHCTVGEDRTGLLAGIYKLLFVPGETEANVFSKEMCAHGYGHADPRKNKKQSVVDDIHNNLTDLYVKLTYLIAKKRLTARLEDSACESDPKNEAEFQAGYQTAMDQHICPEVKP